GYSHHRYGRCAFAAMARGAIAVSFVVAQGKRMTSPLQQKLKITGPSIVTANRVSDGVVIYRTASANWSTSLTDAAIVRNAPDAQALLAGAVADDLNAVGAYVAPVEI